MSFYVNKTYPEKLVYKTPERKYKKSILTKRQIDYLISQTKELKKGAKAND